MKLPRIMLCAGFAAAAGVSLAVNFTSYSQAGVGLVNQSSAFSHEGFDFSTNTPPLGFWGLDDPNHSPGGPTATSLVVYYAGAELTMSKTGGGVFGLSSIDIAEWGVAQINPTFDVTFVGDISGGGTVSNTFTVNNGALPVLQTFNFSGFTNWLICTWCRAPTYLRPRGSWITLTRHRRPRNHSRWPSDSRASAHSCASGGCLGQPKIL